jgi:FixJ family two-component response regulator
MLVARELTNRRIAEELVISERTVATRGNSPGGAGKGDSSALGSAT